MRSIASSGLGVRRAGAATSGTGWAISVLALVGYAFVLAPLVVVIGTSVNRVDMAFPPRSFSLVWFVEAVRHHEFVDAAKISLLLALSAAVVSTLSALLVTMLLRRAQPWVRRVVSTAFLGPFLVPSVILALALYQVVRMMLGTASAWALFIGHVVITMPFPVRTIAAVVEGLDPALEDAAASVGAAPLRTFFHVTLPLIKPGVIAGALFAFIASWNDFPISIFLAPPAMVPLPIKIYTYIQFEYKPLIAALSTCLIGLSVVLVYAIERLVGLSVFIGEKAR